MGGEQDFEAIAKRLVDALDHPFYIEGHHIHIGTSVGIAVSPNDAITVGDLLKFADIALYQAKADGRNTFRYFESGMDDRMRERRQLEDELRAAIDHNEFEMHYQPLYDIASERIVGCEALIRWRHAMRGLVSPADFIPIAEETGLIKQIGAWALKQACSDACGWPEHMFVAVNLSAIQFTGSQLVSDVREALECAGLPAHRLELEITESVILNDSVSVLSVLRELKTLGASISMDDFGTGYSSLAYLQKFPFDKIKIDRSFIASINTKEDSRAIVRAIASMGKSLGMTTTGEGVETLKELECLRTEGCNLAQGYLISRPVPAAVLPSVFSSELDRNMAA